MNAEGVTEANVEAITRQLQQAAGDLTVRLDTDSTDATMTALSESVNEMLVELDGTLLGIQSFGVEVATETQQVATGLEGIQETSTEVGHSIAEIAAGANRQTTKLTETGDELADLSASVEEISDAKASMASDTEEFQDTLDTLDDGGRHWGVRLAPTPAAVSEPLGEVRSVRQPLRRNAETVVRESRFTTQTETAVEAATL